MTTYDEHGRELPEGVYVEEPAPREPSAPTCTDVDLARAIVYARRLTASGATDDGTIILRALLRLVDAAGKGEHTVLELIDHYQEQTFAVHGEIAALRARVAELEAQIAPPRMAWTCTTCGISGTTEMLADDGAAPVCPECRQARHLCMHEPAGHRDAAKGGSK